MSGLRWTEEQLSAHQSKPKRRNKYGNRKVVADDGKTIDSKKELKYREQLRARFRAGEITELAEQVWIRLGPTRKMIVDFVYVDADGFRHYEDVKGYVDPNWKTKQAWAKERGIEIKTV